MKDSTKATLFLAGGALVGAAAYYGATRATDEVASVPAAPLVANGERALLVGDSIALGISGPLGVDLYARGVGLVVAAKTGVTATGLLQILKAHPYVLDDDTTKLAILSLGSNDAAMDDPHVENQAIAELANLLRTRGRQILWVIPPSYRLPPGSVPPPATSEKQDAFSAMMGSVAVTTFYSPSDSVVAAIGADRIHLSPAGYARYAQEIADYVTGVAVS